MKGVIRKFESQTEVEPAKPRGSANSPQTLRPEAMLEAIARSATLLLRAGDLAKAIAKVLAIAGEAVGADRVEMLAVDPAGVPGDLITGHQYWTAPGVATPAGFKEARRGGFRAAGLGTWLPRLKRGETIAGDCRGFRAPVRRFLEAGGVQSTAVAPLIVEGEWRGTLGFDACRAERQWLPAELDTLRTLAELVGAAIGRSEQLQRLSDANRIIESGPTVVCRFAPRYPYPLTFVSHNVRGYGYAPAELLASPERWMQLIEAEDRPAVIAEINAILTGQAEHFRLEFRFRKPDGSNVWFYGQIAPLRGEHGDLAALEGVFSDITARKAAEESLTRSNILLSTAIEGSPDAILIVDQDTQVTGFNRHFIDLWQVPPELVEARLDGPILEVVASRVRNEEAFLIRVRFLYANPRIEGHDELETKDGRFIDRHSVPLYDAHDHYLGRIWFFRDISERKLEEYKMSELARTDPLTDLPNRFAFLERLRLALARLQRGDRPFAILYLDLDHFKDVNDTLGHPVGDTLLRAVADRLRISVRETDVVARFGGDEFAILQDDVTRIGRAEVLATKICKAISEPFFIEGNQIHTTASVGVVHCLRTIDSPEAILMKADLALYRAKYEGRDRFHIHIDELDQEARERVATGEDLRLAVDRNELELYYQPQVEIASGRIVGLEALLRWNHPRRGFLLPAMFIPVAESSGSIVQIGEWVVERTCRQIGIWRDQGIMPAAVAANVSAAQFKLASNLDKVVLASLARYDIDPDMLELELTETVLMETTQRHRDAFERLRQTGVRLAIDDFGTGYSSLDYLRTFRVARLKIDRRFIGDVTTNPDDAIIVRVIVSLGKQFGVEVLAEGVETPEQEAFLVSAGCQLAQGYYLGQPMSAASATALLHKQMKAR